MEEKDLFREYTQWKPMTARELHELLKVTDYKTKLYKKVEEGINSVRENLRHFLLASIQIKRPDIFEKLSEDVKLKDRTRNKVLNEEGNKYVR